jgi:mRNA-degrading endonuclease HigB of HigAB toxin-antitoxin module
LAFAAQEECEDEVDGGSDEIDGGSGDDHDADDSGDDRDADDGDCADDVDDDSSVDDYDSSDDGDGEIADDADDSEVDMDARDAYYSEIVNDSDDAEFDMDARNAYSEKIRANDEAYRVSVDEGADPDEASAKANSANFKAYKVYLKANKKYVEKQRWEEIDAITAEYKANDDAFKILERKQIQDTLDSDARIANNVPSAADRIFLEEVNTRNRAIFDKAMQGRTDRLEFLAAADPFFREREAHNAQATRMLQAREANGEDARTVRASWEAYNRYGCFGALDDAFFDPRNG